MRWLSQVIYCLHSHQSPPHRKHTLYTGGKTKAAHTHVIYTCDTTTRCLCPMYLPKKVWGYPTHSRYYLTERNRCRHKNKSTPPNILILILMMPVTDKTRRGSREKLRTHERPSQPVRGIERGPNKKRTESSRKNTLRLDGTFLETSC